MRTTRLFLGIFALALLLPLLLLACGGSDEPTDGPSSERSTAEPTDLPDSERATDEPDGRTSSGQTTAAPTAEGAEPPPTPSVTAGPTPAGIATPTRPRVIPMSTPRPTDGPPMAQTSPETDREALVALYNATGGPHWKINNLDSESAYQDVVTNGTGKLPDLLQAMRSFLGDNDMMAYLTMMAQRMVELHRVLKNTGSIYLHCDPTASHYLKLLMDSVFGNRNLRNEIIWHYRKWTTGKFTFQRNHDIILFYSRSQNRDRVFNQLFMERAPSTLKRFGTAKIVSGHDESGQRVPSQVESEESQGVRQDDVWEIGRVPPIKQLFPTQKPDALLERIINASSDEGDIVLDPFCGCGTAIVNAERLNRRWIGIDITHLADTLIRHRLHDTFKGELKPYEVLGQPQDVASAQALATDSENSGRYQFEWWALGLVDARPAQDRKKGADSGVDGYINFFDDNSGKAKRIVVQVKSGHVTRNQIATLKGDMEREKAEIGLFVTLQPLPARWRPKPPPPASTPRNTTPTATIPASRY